MGLLSRKGQDMKIAILGAGDISQEFMEGLVQTNCAHAVAVYNHNLQHAQQFATQHKLAAVYDDYQALLAADGFDTVYVGLPNGLHYEYAKQALIANKNVIVEKPFTATLAQFDELYQLADEHHVYLLEMDRVLAQPNLQVIRDYLPQIEPVRLLSLNFCKYSRKYSALLQGQVSNVFTTKMAGGALYDLGVYGLHLVTALFGMPKTVTYRVNKYQDGVDLTGCLVMEYDGFLVDMMQSKNSQGEMHTIIQGEKGTLLSSMPASVLPDLTLWQGKEKKNISADVSLFGTAYTMQAFAKIIANNDQEAYQKRRQHSRMVMDIMCQARVSAGIVFEADQK